MPGFAKSPPALLDRFDAVAAEYPDVVRRMTFGYPCLYVGGNMVSGVYEASWFVRLDAAATAELSALAGAGPFSPMPGRPMTGYTLLPSSVIDDDRAIREWVERAIDFGASLPPKTPKPKSASKSRSTPA
jgi:TfoX/Sxy family transcriptional regulator of competence genes